jgi:general secretion pathway protein C
LEGQRVRYRFFIHFNRKVVSVWGFLLSFALIASDPNTTAPASGPVKRVSISTLQLAIVGAIVAKDKTSNVVLLKYLATNEVKAHRVGNVLLAKYTLFDITENSITLQTYQQNQVSLTIAYRDKFFQDLQKVPAVVAAPPVTGLIDTYREDGFERNQGEIRVTEAYKNNLLSPAKLTETLMQASAEPFMQNGQIAGFKLDLIDPNSLYSKSGLVNGDVITEINGVPLNDAAGAIRLLQSLRNAKSLSLSFMRGGAVIPLNIAVQ